jgi:hypothetical protein
VATLTLSRSRARCTLSWLLYALMQAFSSWCRGLWACAE